MLHLQRSREIYQGVAFAGSFQYRAVSRFLTEDPKRYFGLQCLLIFSFSCSVITPKNLPGLHISSCI